METRKGTNRLLRVHLEPNLNKGIEMNTTITKASDIEQAYNVAAALNCSSEGCYALAVAAAHKLGGIEITNSNDDQHTVSFAPSRTFEFDDASSAYVTYGGVFSY